MTTLGVARTDFLRARRTMVVRLLAVLLSGFVVVTFFGIAISGHTPMSRAYLSQQFFGILLFPLLAIGAAYLSIAGERESGNVQYLLSLPNNRAHVIFGKLLSRLAIVGGAALLAYAIGTVIIVVLGTDWTLGGQFTFVGFTTLYLLSYVGIAVGISAATASRMRAMAGSLSVYVVANLFWVVGPDATRPPNVVAWLFELVGVSLSEAAVDVLWLLGPTGAYTRGVGVVVSDNPLDPVASDAWFLSAGAAAVVLLAWTVLPVVLGYLRFARADLG